MRPRHGSAGNGRGHGFLADYEYAVVGISQIETARVACQTGGQNLANDDWASAGRGHLFDCRVLTEVISVDPTEMIELPRGSKALPAYLSIEEVDLLIAAPDRSTPFGLRNAAMLDLAYATPHDVLKTIQR